MVLKISCRWLSVGEGFNILVFPCCKSPSGLICVSLWILMGSQFNCKTLSSLLSAGVLRAQAQLLGFDVVSLFLWGSLSGGGFSSWSLSYLACLLHAVQSSMFQSFSVGMSFLRTGESIWGMKE